MHGVEGRLVWTGLDPSLGQGTSLGLEVLIAASCRQHQYIAKVGQA